MTPSETVAYVQAMSVCALAEIEGMKAENARCAVLGQSMAYTEDDFEDVINRYGIHHNGVCTLFQDAQRA